MKKMVLMITVILMCIMIVSSAMTEENLSINLKEATDEDLVRAIDIIKAEQRSRLKTKIVLDPSEITLAKGTTSKITAFVIELPEDVTAGKFTWGSNDPGIATCSNGSVKIASQYGNHFTVDFFNFNVHHLYLFVIVHS